MSSRSLLLSLCAATLFSACSSAPVEPESEPVFYPGPPDPPRVQFLRSVTIGEDLEEGRSGLDTMLFGEAQTHKSVMAPYGLLFDEGVVYVCDVQQGVILTLDFREGAFSYLKLKGRGELKKPNNIARADDGRYYIADFGRRQIVVLSPDHTYEAELGPFSDVSVPVDVEVLGDELYIVDKGTRTVKVVDRETGELHREFGQLSAEEEPPAPAPGEQPDPDRPVSLVGPTNVAVLADGTAYVVDTIECRIFVFDNTGKFTGYIGSPGQTVGQFGRPKGLQIIDDLIFAIDASFENCQILDMTGEPLMFFAGGGDQPGDLYLPTGIFITKEGFDDFEGDYAPGFEPEYLIFISSQFGSRKINVYALGKSSKFTYDA